MRRALASMWSGSGRARQQLETVGERRQLRRLEQVAEIDAETEVLLDAEDDAERADRVAARLEKAGITAWQVGAEDLFPHPAHCRLVDHRCHPRASFRALAPHNNATSLQVTVSVLAGIVWAMEHPDRGLLEPDELDHHRILEICKPYLGRMHGEYTDWSPLSDRERLFPEDLDFSDPWQFKNVRVI